MFQFLQTIWYAFQQSDTAGKGIVVLLIVMSTFSWGILIDRWFFLKAQQKLLGRFKQSYVKLRSPLQMRSQFSSIGSVLATLGNNGFESLVNILGDDPAARRQLERHNLLPRALQPAEIERLRSLMQEDESRLLKSLQGWQSWLGTIVALSPFCGLFGTVWGVMATFIGIAKVGRPDLMAIAPGISGALLTTVAGLLVAIPALVGNNVIQGSLQSITEDMDNFIEDFLTGIALTPVQEARPAPQPVQAPAPMPPASAPAARTAPPPMPRSSFDTSSERPSYPNYRDATDDSGERD